MSAGGGPRSSSTGPNGNGGRQSFGFVEIRLYGLLTILFALAGIVYYVWSDEWAGTVLLILSSGLTGLTGGYLYLQARLERRLRDGGGSAGGEPGGAEEYLPHTSPWPLELGVGLTVLLVGFVLGRWVVVGGAAVCAHACYGWIEQSRRRA
jgi:hypothetical protein